MGNRLRSSLLSLARYPIIFLVPGFLLLPGTSFAQETEVLIRNEDFSRAARSAIDSLYNRNPEGAADLLRPWRSVHEDHPIWELWDGMVLWWEVLEDLHDYSHDEEFLNSMQRADYAASRLLNRQPGHPDALIIRAVANGYAARLYANREEWITSVRIGSRAYSAHQELMDVAPDLPDNAFAEGIKLYYSEYLPDAYPVVKAASWFLPEGDREKGIETLYKASESGVFARPEALYFLGMILLNYENRDEQAIDIFETLVSSYPDNFYFKRVYLRNLGSLNRYSDIEIFLEKNFGSSHTSENELDPQTELAANYWSARSMYHFGQWEEALNRFEQALASGKKLVNRRERDLYLLSAYYAGRSLDILGRKEEAADYYRISEDQSVLPVLKRRSAKRLEAL